MSTYSDITRPTGGVYAQNAAAAEIQRVSEKVHRTTIVMSDLPSWASAPTIYTEAKISGVARSCRKETYDQHRHRDVVFADYQ